MPFLLNQDVTDFFMSRSEEKMTQDELLRQVDLYECGGDCIIILNGNAQKTSFESNVFESMWNGIETRNDGRSFYRGKKLAGNSGKYAKHMKILNDNAGDPFTSRLAYGKKHGHKIYLSMRMNDVHCVDNFDHLLISDFWREHQDCLITNYTSKDNWWYHTFDYAKKEVYDYHLELVREYLTRFDSDGLELDWMRTPYYFKPGTEDQNAEILTRFIRDSRKIADECADRNGHPVDLIVRLPSRPEDARRMGFDAVTWVKEKLVDRIVVTSYWGVTDFDIPLELWRALLGNEVKITAGLEILCRSNPFQKTDFYNDAAVVFGFASSFYYRGSDDIYLFNHMDETGIGTGMGDIKELRPVLENLGKRENVERQKRRHVVTYTDFLARTTGVAMDSILPMTLNKNCNFLRLNLGGSVKNRNAKLIIACDNGEPDEIRCGGVICQKTEEVFTGKLPSDVKKTIVYHIPDDALKEGDNMLFFRGNDNRLIWCEVDFEAL